MAHKYIRDVSGRARGSAFPIVPSSEAMDLWPLVDPFKVDKKAIWLEASNPFLYINGGPGDGPAGFYLKDRIGERDYTNNFPSTTAHPWAVTDEVSGKPCLMFGAGGAGGNILDNNYNGRLVCDGSDDVDIFTPGEGISIAVKFRLPTVGSPVLNGATFPLPSNGLGGTIIGGGSTVTTSDAMWFGTHQTTGAIAFRTRNSGGSSGGGTVAGSVVDLRDGLWHDAICTYNPSTNANKIWVDGSLVVNITTATIDFSTSAGSPKAIIGGGGRTGLSSNRFGGAFAGGLVMQGNVLDGDDDRALVRDWLATL